MTQETTVAPMKLTKDDASPRPAALLQVENLRTTFVTPSTSVTAVDDVSISVAGEETLGIVGESGSGKSVLARSIMGLVSPGDKVQREGRILFDGDDLTAWPRKKVRDLWGSEIAMVLQDPLTSLNPVKRIGTQLTETIRRHDRSLGRRGAFDRGVDLLRRVGIPEPTHRMHVYPHQMSGGMRQRVGIAIALSGNPRLLFADEPTTALDVTVQHQILDLLGDEQRERSMAMVLVTHDLGVVATRADRIAVMYAGRIVETAPTKTLFADVKMPYTRALLDALPKLDTPPHSRLRAIKGSPPNLAAPPAGCRFAPRCLAAADRCRSAEPPLISTADPEHLFRCWYPVGSVEYERAVAAAPSVGTTATASSAGPTVPSGPPEPTLEPEAVR